MTPNMLPWETLQALLAVYQTITTANGYLTNIGDNASLENPQQEVEKLPDLAITGRPKDGGEQGDLFRSWTMEVFLEARVPASRQDAQFTAWKVHADLLAATPKPKRDDSLPKGAHSIKVESSSIVQDTPSRPFVVVQVVLSIGLVVT